MATSVGLDVGGAHLKVAVVENKRVTASEQFACPLWQGMSHLHAALNTAQRLITKADTIGVTMTGELSDLFDDRQTGVTTLIDELTQKLGPDIHVWLGKKGFKTADAAKAHPDDTGSTNFLASATFAALQVSDGVLIDFGSTTADIVPFLDRAPVVTGLTDGARLVSGELVYTGMTRTAVMGVATAAPFRGQWQSLAREYLATMGDVRRILGELPKGVDLHATADGRSQNIEHSVARFARMFGRDTHDGTRDDWRQSAEFIREQQVHSIHTAVMRVLSGVNLPASAPVIAAGIGSDTARVLARRIGRPAKDFGTLAQAGKRVQRATTYAATAAAIAHLVADHAER